MSNDGRIGLPRASVDPITDLLTALKFHERIADAVEAATQADQLCAEALNMVSLDPDTTTVQQTQSVQGAAVRSAVEEIRDQTPRRPEP